MANAPERTLDGFAMPGDSNFSVKMKQRNESRDFYVAIAVRKLLLLLRRLMNYSFVHSRISLGLRNGLH